MAADPGSEVVANKKWIISEADSDLERRLAGEISCSPVLAALLVRRGITSREEAARFLSPKLSHLSDPAELPDMQPAVERIERAVRERSRIAIFGDYDVDGVSSTCLLLDFFRLIGHPVEYRLPHRLSEGYGLREATVREFATKGVQLVITVDNGSSSREEIALARELGIDVVVTDHHQPSADLPEPVALVNPWVDQSGVAYRHFAGVGVTFKVVWGLCQRLSRAKKLSPELREFLLDSLALVALGTVSDVVPLHGENRVLVKYGLRALENSRRPGIRRMVEAALDPNRSGSRLSVRADDVGFRLGPRINAVGRLGRADVAIRILTTESADLARELVPVLERENRKRREMEQKIYEDARRRVSEEIDLSRERAIVLGDPAWHPGVIGIVASRLTDEFFRPTLLVAVDGERSRGSGRSIPGVHLTEALARCRGLLRSFGGHAMAAGVELEGDRLPDLRRALSEAIELPVAEMVPEVRADLEVPLGQINGDLLRELSCLAPHGEGNPEPLLVAGDLEVVGRARAMGDKGQHLSFFVRGPGEGRAFRAVAFGKGDLCESIRSRSRIALVFRPTWNCWQGRREIELNVREIRLLS